MPDKLTDSTRRLAGTSRGIELPAAPGLVGRSDTDLHRAQRRLEHAGLEARTHSMPHGGSRPPRSGLPPPRLNPAGGELANRTLLDTAERSDRFRPTPSVAGSDVWSEVDLRSEGDLWSERAEHGSSRDSEHDAAPPAERSWRAVASSVLGRMGAAGQTTVNWVNNRYQAASATVGHAAQAAYGAVRDQAVQSAEAVGIMAPSGRLAGALAGHLVHQSVTVGVPTFLREMMAEAMVLSMRHMPPNHAVMLQTGMAVVSVGAQLLREAREKRNPDEAARGFHGLSPQQWNDLSDGAQATLRKQQRNHSRMVTLMQLTASGTHIAIGIAAAKADDAEKAGKLFVTDFKTMLYGGMRDSLQASFNMVGPQDDTFGVNGSHMTSSALFYGGANIAANFAFSTLPGMVPGAALADDVLRGKSGAMSQGDAWGVKAEVALVKAAINTILEASDWFSVNQQEANQAGTVQRWDPKLKLLDPGPHDFGRVLDQTPARMTAIGASNAMYNAITFAMKDQPQAAQDLVANVVVGAFASVQYKTIGGTWQADSAVRKQPVRQPPERDLEQA
jgi:hypothetical protein